MAEVPRLLFDDTYHYPPELLNLLADVIPALFRSKQDVITFFRGAGVDPALYADWRRKIEQDAASAKKREIAHSVLCRLNEKKGDDGLRQRREVLKRIVEFEDFSTCWPNDRLKGQGLVAEIRRVVNVKDSFTRMRIESEEERKARLAAHEAQIRAKQQKTRERQQIKDNLFALFSERDHHKRGKALEPILNRLFKSFDILVKESFTLKGINAEGIVEQIDGVVEFDGHIYLVEMRWWEAPVGQGDIAQHLVRVMSRHDARGIFISASGFTDPAITQSKEFLHHRVSVLCDLEEIVQVLEREKDLKELLRKKVQAAIVQKQPLFYCIEDI